MQGSSKHALAAQGITKAGDPFPVSICWFRRFGQWGVTETPEDQSQVPIRHIMARKIRNYRQNCIERGLNADTTTNATRRESDLVFGRYWS